MQTYQVEYLSGFFPACTRRQNNTNCIVHLVASAYKINGNKSLNVVFKEWTKLSDQSLPAITDCT